MSKPCLGAFVIRVSSSYSEIHTPDVRSFQKPYRVIHVSEPLKKKISMLWAKRAEQTIKGLLYEPPLAL